MNSYVDIIYKKNKDIRQNIWLNELYTSFHKRLFDIYSKNIGISFPNFHLTCGDILRVHGSCKDLQKLFEVDWLRDLKEICKVSEIQDVPENIQFINVSRQQATMTNSKLKRLLKRGSISEDEVKKYQIKMLQEKSLDNPFVEIISESSKQKHRRYFKFSTPTSEFRAGEFDSFGLGKDGANVPWF